ncbi:MAG: hypothetical protein GW938_02780 [Leptospira sp.]|nr:hypothetical protein [Leptospira sp.]NCS93256.1 hypothetical protein [Leptospira sp.]
MERIFSYDIKFYRKKLLIRLAIVFISFSSFLIWNYFQVEEESKIDFLKIFLPLSLFLGIFLYRNFLKQIKLLSETAFVIRGKNLIQFEGKVEVNEMNLDGLMKIQVGEYKSFPRVILEWEERAISLINLKDHKDFVLVVEKIAKLKHEWNDQTGNFFNKRMFYFLLPTIIYFLLFVTMYKSKIPFLNSKTLFLFININLLIYFLYGVDQKQQEYTGIYQTRRKIIFILVAIFFYQVFIEFSGSLGML